LIELRSLEVLINVIGEQDSKWARDKGEYDQPENVIANRNVQIVIEGKDLTIVGKPNPLDGTKTTNAIPECK